MSDLSAAIKIAVDAHSGQNDKAGQPYILHPLRVMQMVDDDECRIVAVLHDAVEDGGVGLGDVLALFGETIWSAVDAVTRREGELYLDYVRRAGSNEIGKIVKLADLKDNLSPSRSASLNQAMRTRYLRAQNILGEL